MASNEEADAMRFFNTAGPCDPEKHYTLPPERRLPEARGLIDQELFFVIHAPRQSGKTTLVRTLARKLTSEGRYTALLASCEVGQAAGGDMEAGIAAVLDALRLAAVNDLPEELRPPGADAAVPATTRLQDLLSRWCQQSPRTVVLFLDEIDALMDAVLISVLRQLRAGYGNRPQGFPQSVALIGLRDVRDYKARLRPDTESLGTSSPFNIKVESLTLPNFAAEEIAELYDQHTQDTGQVFTLAAKARAFELTRGQPWLVNALARQAVEKLVPDRAVPIEPVHMDRAKEILIERRDTHLDSLVDRLREPRVKRVLEPILAGEFLSPDVLDDDIQFVKDLGLIAKGPAGLEIANPIYREIIPRALTGVLQESLPVLRAPFIAPDGKLLFEKILADFRAFWCQHAEFFLQRQPYSEAAAQLIFMAYLQRVVNGGGFIDREYAVGSGRIDLCVRWPHPGGLQRWAVELKVWRDGRPDPLPEGLEQLTGYLARLGLAEGTLILFDGRSQAPPLGDRCHQSETEYQAKRIAILRL
ncbi:MAG TPA: ATP-binding protein [Thermoanaerobaculia bacterium]|jgi:molybdopterin-guanine dinucleotide biosynthesis protein|nr:ATP-binding protein [Thermoanaerobaculia bacterium]